MRECSHVTCYVSHAICHVLCVLWYVACVMCHVSFVIFFWVWAPLSRLSGQQGHPAYLFLFLFYKKTFWFSILPDIVRPDNSTHIMQQFFVQNMHFYNIINGWIVNAETAVCCAGSEGWWPLSPKRSLDCTWNRRYQSNYLFNLAYLDRFVCHNISTESVPWLT